MTSLTNGNLQDIPISVEWSSNASVSGESTHISYESIYSTPSKPENVMKTPGKFLPHTGSSEGQTFQTPRTNYGEMPLLLPHGLPANFAILHQPACSPNLHTPVGANATRSLLSRSGTPSCKFSTPNSGSLKGQKSIPRYHTTPGGTSKQILPNPFEGYLLDRINSDSPMFSPDMFKVVEPGSAEKTPKSFRWSIDQIAILKPADIEEMPIQQDTLNINPFPEREGQVQKAIDQYFDKGNIVPSPWTESVKKFVLPRTPVLEPELQRPETRNSDTIDEGSKDACCQTKLTFPVDLDLEKVLGNNFLYTGDNNTVASDCDNQADISTSSLRRKLFFHGDEGTPLSPVRCNKSRVAEVMDITSPALSPLKFDTPLCQGKLSPMQTPSTGQFSSSPIHGIEGHITPGIRRCSTAPGIMSSPEFSPIGTGIADCLPRSPACFPLQATPSSGRRSHHIASPGMSPIVIKDGGYTASPDLDKISSKSDSLRRRAMRGQLERLPVPRELQMSACDSPVKFDHESQRLPSESTPDLLSHDENAQDIDMSFDHLEKAEFDNEDQIFKERPEFTEFRENFEYDGENTLGFQGTCTGQYSQDTGYQTYSQSVTNPDMGLTQECGASSNITSHFSSLPASLIGQDVEKLNNSNNVTPICADVDFREKYSKENVPFRNCKNSSSEHHAIKSRPSSLIFSELQNLANKFPSSSLSSNTLSYDTPLSMSNSGVVNNVQINKKYFASDCIQTSVSGNKIIRRGEIEQLSPSEADRVVITEHSKKYTQGSMINHEQIYEPPIYVMTSNSQDIHMSQSDGARTHYSSSNRGEQNLQSSCISGKNQWQVQGSATLDKSVDSHFVPTLNNGSEKGGKYLHSESATETDLDYHTRHKVSYFLPAKPKLYHGRPASINPAFKIETLTPEETPLVHEDIQFSALPNSSTCSYLDAKNINHNYFAERLLSPDEHPPSPSLGSLGHSLCEADVVLRAKKVLGHHMEEPILETNNNLEEPMRIDKTQPTEKPQAFTYPWCGLGNENPQKIKMQQLVKSLEKRKKDITHMLPSDVALQVLQKAEKDLVKLKNGEILDPSFLDNTSFQDSCIVDDYQCEAEVEKYETVASK